METAICSQSFEAAASVLPMNRPTSHEATMLQPFADSLDHLRALELEATIMLAVTYYRKYGSARSDEDDEPAFPEICLGSGLEGAKRALARISSENRRREDLTVALGRNLTFIALCHEWKLENFEIKALLLLLMQHVAPDFMAIYSDCAFGKNRKGGMEVRTLISIICDDLRDQLASRRFFSVEATMIRNDLIVAKGDFDDTSNILDEIVMIHERFVRFILGDNNLYNSCFRYIKREKSTVSLDQVVLACGVKDELVGCMEQYLSADNTDMIDGVEEFFGYGSALVYLFHGPSGTGKTMMAKALAARFNRTIFSLTADDMREMPGSYQEIIAMLFREAALQGGIVFFDECDDMFEKGGRASRALLIELEKARCAVILATNRPVELDPALERRISMKTYFPIPDTHIRRKMWETLMPPSARLGEDVDLEEFAERYRFTGGLIRNAIFLALTVAGSKTGAEKLLSAELLHFAASKQTATLADERRICSIQFPDEPLDRIPLEANQRRRLKNIAAVWDRLRKRQAGLSMVITASNITAAERAARGVARECDLSVRSYDFEQVISRAPDDRILDPVTQRPFFPLDYAFSPAAGTIAMTLFIDHENMLGNMMDKKKEKMGDLYMAELLARLRKHTGMFCIVGIDTGDHRLPPEFSIHERLLYPDHDEQEAHWLQQLGTLSGSEMVELSRLIDCYPLHIPEIDFVFRQAATLATIKRLEEKPNFEELLEVLAQYRGKSAMPLLFGGE